MALFGAFCCACVLVASYRKGFKNATIFVVTACLTLSLVQLPWELRNQRLLGQFTMQDTQYYGSALWAAHWVDWRDVAKAIPLCRGAWGDYLRPDLSKQITRKLNANVRSGTAAMALLGEIIQHPRKAFLFKLSAYDTLWLGNRINRATQVFAFLSLMLFVLFAWRNRHILPPELWTFPLFMLCLSVLIFYESRYVHPFYLLITPVSIGLLIEQWRSKRAKVLPPGKQQAIAVPADIHESASTRNEGARVRWSDRISARLLLKSVCVLVACLLVTSFAASLSCPWLVESIMSRYEESSTLPVSGSKNVLFGSSVHLHRAYIWKRGDVIEVTSHWSATQHPQMAKMLGVHLVDKSGKIISQVDHKLYSGSHDWADHFWLEKGLPTNATAIALAVYDDPKCTLFIEGGRCDWGNHRLLLPLPAQ